MIYLHSTRLHVISIPPFKVFLRSSKTLKQQTLITLGYTNIKKRQRNLHFTFYVINLHYLYEHVTNTGTRHLAPIDISPPWTPRPYQLDTSPHILDTSPQSTNIIIIFPRNVSFRGYYVFVSNAAAAAAASQFRC